METQRLQNLLMEDLSPVRPVNRRNLMGFGLLVAAGTAAVYTLLLGVRPDFGARVSQTDFSVSLFLLLGTAIGAGILTVLSGIPGRLVKGAQALLGVSLVFHGAMLAYSGVGVPALPASPAMALLCASLILGGTVTVAGTLLVMVSRLAPTASKITVSLCLLTGLCVGAFACQIHCPSEDLSHKMIGHWGLAVAGALILVAPFTLLLQKLQQKAMKAKTSLPVKFS